jgi:hypothetical protein
MRVVTVVCSILLLSVVGLAQTPERGVAGFCPYGCGPYIPMLTTPIVSFTTVSPDPVGARNATGGLIAGATNSTLSEVGGNTDAVYTEPVWMSGGGMLLISRAVNVPFGGMRMMRRQMQAQPAGEHEAAAAPQWIYFGGPEQGVRSLEQASAANRVRPAQRNFSNQDVERLNQQNGYVHYDSKTEKIQ